MGSGREIRRDRRRCPRNEPSRFFRRACVSEGNRTNGQGHPLFRRSGACRVLRTGQYSCTASHTRHRCHKKRMRAALGRRPMMRWREKETAKRILVSSLSVAATAAVGFFTASVLAQGASTANGTCDGVVKRSVREYVTAYVGILRKK